MSTALKARADAATAGVAEGQLDLEHLLASLEEPIRTRPVRRMTQGELEKYLEKAADMLRGNVDHSEFRGYVFALLFYKRISDRYDQEVRELTARLGDEALARDPKMHNFVVPEDARWSAVVRTPKTQLGQALNDAMLAIEKANAPKFDGILTNKIDFNKQDELPRDKLVNLINHFSSHAMDRAHVPDDLFGARELIREHIDVDEINRDYPAYLLDENYLSKIKDKEPDAKALEIEAMLSAELKVRVDQDEEFQPLSEKLQRIIDQKRAGQLAGVALIQELEGLTAAVVAAIEETKRPLGQSIAMLAKDRVEGIEDGKAAEVAAAILNKADSHCFEGWKLRQDMDAMLTREFTLLLADQYGNLGLIGTDNDFVSRCIRLLRRVRYRGGQGAA